VAYDLRPLFRAEPVVGMWDNAVVESDRIVRAEMFVIVRGTVATVRIAAVLDLLLHAAI